MGPVMSILAIFLHFKLIERLFTLFFHDFRLIWGCRIQWRWSEGSRIITRVWNWPWMSIKAPKKHIFHVSKTWKSWLTGKPKIPTKRYQERIESSFFFQQKQMSYKCNLNNEHTQLIYVKTDFFLKIGSSKDYFFKRSDFRREGCFWRVSAIPTNIPFRSSGSLEPTSLIEKEKNHER